MLTSGRNHCFLTTLSIGNFQANDWYCFIYNLPLEVNFVDQMPVVMDHINHPDHFLLDFVLELNCMSSGETRGETVTPTPPARHTWRWMVGSNIVITLRSPLMNYFDI